MICFIPAWYAENRWRENEQQWYVRRMHSEVDDTVKQIQLFTRKSKFATQTILLNFAPNFRHFLHRQGLLHSEYWSCFDAIQEIKTRRPGILTMRNLKWPDNIEFINSPFLVIAMQNGKKYAQIDFGEDGNMIQIDMFRDERIIRRNIYDDRGFLSSTVVYRDGVPAYEQYLNEKGVWKICCYADGHVDVNPAANSYLIRFQGNEQKFTFKSLRYESLDEIIAEVFGTYVSFFDSDNIFCVAMHDRHSQVLLQTLDGRKKIVSFFNDRCMLREGSASKKLTSQAQYIVVNDRGIIDSAGLRSFEEAGNLMDITPFDSRVDFGHSQQLQQQNVLVAVDGLEDDIFEELVVYLTEYMLTNENVRVHLFTRDASYGMEEKLLGKTSAVLKKHGFDPDYARKDMGGMSENEIEEQAPILFYVSQCVDELSASKCLRTQRIVIDMAHVTDLFLQIGALSMGLPQIVREQTEYVVDHKNGRIIEQTSALREILPFYLDTFKNWNQAVIESYEIGKKFNSDVLVERWEKVIAYVEYN